MNEPTLHQIARSLGYVRLNAEEQALVENLRWTRHAGREKVYCLAEKQRRKRPWVETLTFK